MKNCTILDACCGGKMFYFDKNEIAEEITASILQAVRGDEVPIPKNARTELLNRIKQWQDENNIS